MTYKVKYVNKLKFGIDRPSNIPGVKPGDVWRDEDALIARDIYYGYLKHKAQAKFRKEEYSLTAEQWADLWPKDKWLRRGRTKESLCMMQISPGLGWHIGNVDIVERIEYLKRASEYKK